MKIASVLKNAAAELSSSSTSAQLDAEILLSHVLKKNRSYLYAHNDESLTDSEIQSFQNLLKKRKSGKPIAYLIGMKEFWSLELNVDENVLIPRPETELLIEICLEKLDKNTKLKIADLGTGSGAIALALAYERPAWQIFACDNSEKALEIAKQNAKKFNLHNVNFFLGSWFNAFSKTQKFDAIISNPPYIQDKDPHLTKGDVKHEPKSALISGESGLDDLSAIITEAKNHLNTNGIILVEHGYNQATSVQKIMQENGFSNIKTYKDLAKLDRITIGAQKNK
jgi:release factor glutamine methyltransferase